MLQKYGAQVKGLENIMEQSEGRFATEVLTAWILDYSWETIEWLIAHDRCILLPDAKPGVNKASVKRHATRLTAGLHAHPNYTDATDPAKLVRRQTIAQRIIALYELKYK